MDDQQFQRNLASYEQEQGFLKHLTTLSTGSIILVVTFLEKLFANPEWKALVGVAIVSFLFSIIGCIAAHFFSVLGVEKGPEKLQGAKLTTGVASLFLAFGGFIIGIVTLAVFAMKNLY